MPWPRNAKIAFIGSHGIRKTTAALAFASVIQRAGRSVEFAREVVKPALEQVDGISRAEVVGGADREILVEPDSREPWFLCEAHTDNCLDDTLARFERAVDITIRKMSDAA